MARTKTYYVWNGYHVEHVGSRESCEDYIRGARFLYNVRGLTICVQRNGRYVPAD